MKKKEPQGEMRVCGVNKEIIQPFRVSTQHIIYFICKEIRPDNLIIMQGLSSGLWGGFRVRVQRSGLGIPRIWTRIQTRQLFFQIRIRQVSKNKTRTLKKGVDPKRVQQGPRPMTIPTSWQNLTILSLLISYIRSGLLVYFWIVES